MLTCRVCKSNNLKEDDFPTYRYKGTSKRRQLCRICYQQQAEAVPNYKQRRASAHRKWRDNKPGSCMIGSRYQMSQEEYACKVEEQNNSCALCGRPASSFKKRLGVDHDHKCCPERAKSCGKCVRGLLCTGCNAKLGWLESCGILKKVIEYLKKYNKN